MSFDKNESVNQDAPLCKCPICGKLCGNPVSMANCILKDEEKRKTEAENKRKEQLTKEKELRFNDVKKSWEMVNEEVERVKKLEEKLRTDYPCDKFDFSDVKPISTILNSPYITVNGKDISGYTDKEIEELAKRVSNFFNGFYYFGL